MTHWPRRLPIPLATSPGTNSFRALRRFDYAEARQLEPPTVPTTRNEPSTARTIRFDAHRIPWHPKVLEEARNTEPPSTRAHTFAETRPAEPPVVSTSMDKSGWTSTIPPSNDRTLQCPQASEEARTIEPHSARSASTVRHFFVI